jgi:hypothetical protein
MVCLLALQILWNLVNKTEHHKDSRVLGYFTVGASIIASSV